MTGGFLLGGCEKELETSSGKGFELGIVGLECSWRSRENDTAQTQAGEVGGKWDPVRKEDWLLVCW